jgi:hypothetical protein
VDVPVTAKRSGGVLPETLTYLDATSTTPPMMSDGALAIHVLWTAPSSEGLILAGEDDLEPGSLVGRRCQPGDTLLVPSRVRFAVGSGIVAFLAGTSAVREGPFPSAASAAEIEHPPTHGLNVFSGHNRRTICAAKPGLLLERWKLTQPLALDLPNHQSVYVTNLVTPVALSWEGGSELLERTASRILPAGLGRVTFVPDGLGYVLIARVPDLYRDAITSLRAAGYNRAEIASIGVPRPGCCDFEPCGRRGVPESD